MVDIRRPTLSLEKVAEHFDTTVKTVRCWIRGVGGRRLEAVKLGGSVRTTWEALERFAIPLSDEQSYRHEQTELALNAAAASQALREQFGK